MKKTLNFHLYIKESGQDPNGIDQDNLPVGGQWTLTERLKVIGEAQVGDELEIEMFKNNRHKNGLIKSLGSKPIYTMRGNVLRGYESNLNRDGVKNNRAGNIRFVRTA